MTNSCVDHQTNEAVALAGEWLAKSERKKLSRPLIPQIREQFGLSIAEAIEACRVATVNRESANAKP